MQYQQTPEGLSQMFNANVSNGGGSIAATPAMMGLWAQQQQADNMTQQDQGRQLAYDTANDPLKLQEKTLANQTTQGQLPGIIARSNMSTRQDSNEATTNDAAIKAKLADLDAKTANSHIDATNALGTRLSQMAVETRGNPMGAAARIKQELAASGHGDLYNSDWDTANPLNMAADLEDTGQKIQDTSSKFRSALQLRELQNQGLAYRSDATVRAAQVRADAALQSVRDTLSSKLTIAEKKQTTDNKIAELTDLALHATDPDERSSYMKAIDGLKQLKIGIAAASAQVGAGVKPAMGPLGITDNNHEAAPAPVFNGAQESNTPAPAAPMAAPAGWPTGAIQNSDGSISYNGKVYRKK